MRLSTASEGLLVLIIFSYQADFLYLRKVSYLFSLFNLFGSFNAVDFELTLANPHQYKFDKILLNDLNQ